MSDTATASEITFEQGYERLKTIVARLDEDNVSVDEMCRLFAEGKSLEHELRGYLEQQQGRLDEIEAGENLPAFSIVAPSQPPASGGDFTAPPSAGDFVPAGGGGSDDDIPF